MSEMVERVARALAEKNNAPEWDEIDESDCGDRGYLLRADYRDLARVAIAAMRVPTAAMKQTGFELAGDPCWQEDVGKAWQAMIDEALK